MNVLNILGEWNDDEKRQDLIHRAKDEYDAKTKANAIFPIKVVPVRIDKKWGYEKWVVNNDEFCGKLLHFNKGAQFSCHAHHKKREVFEIERGLVELMTIDQRDASQTKWILKPGDVVEIPRFLPHQITALEESEVREYSTTHREDDSFRVLPGDSQK